MTCWCDDCCHNRDFECQLGANVEITADHECDSFVDYIDTEIYNQVFYRRVEHDGVQYKRKCYGKREEQNGIVFYHLAKELGGEVPCPEGSTCGMCIANWLSQETDQPKPQWQDAMMKNFLRRVEDVGT